jgi:uncharacterized repeat protein (TIGR03803 family)
MHSSTMNRGAKDWKKDRKKNPESAGSKSALGCALWSYAAIFCVLLAAAQLAGAQTESILHSFINTPDGDNPRSSVILDAAGNIYGTTLQGGVYGHGSVFMTTPEGKETALYSFTGATDGNYPIAGVVLDKKTGNLYGATLAGGASGNGTVFEVTPSGKETVLYSFKGGVDGANPYSAPLRAGTNIYGMTEVGGAFGYGTVFKLNAAGNETVLHSFNSASPTLDGAYPVGDLVLEKGVLYGLTNWGGAFNFGAIFSITTKGVEKVLYSFKGGTTDGYLPYGAVVFDKSGNLYGTTHEGGASGQGIVFELTPAGTEVVLHSFGANSTDGKTPTAGLIFHKNNFYGTALQGGSAGLGTVFEITPDGVETVLHSFTGGSDGTNPVGALGLGKKGTLYGTTAQGGASNFGTVFKVVP